MSRARDISDGKFANDLEVDGSAGATFKLTSTDTTGADTELLGQIDFVSSDSSTGSAGTQARIKGVYEDNGDSSGIAFITGASTGSGTPTISEVIRHEGKVGIGTNSPDAKLHIEVSSGDANLKLEDGSAVSMLIDQNSIGGSDVIRFKTGSSLTERARITDSGSLFINTTNTTPNPGINLGPSGGMSQGNNNGTSGFYFNYITRNGSLIGSITQSGTTGVAFNTSSDYRLKENVADMTGAITRVKALAPKRFNWVADDDDRTVDGFLAHEAQAVVPEAVTGTHNEVETWTQQQIDDGDAPDGTSAGDNKLDEDGNTIPVMQGIDQSKLVPLLTGALKEAITKIETLETEMTALKARVTALENA